jgi:hypothetical protein
MDHRFTHKRFAGDNPLFRNRFEREFGNASDPTRRHLRADQGYKDWLRTNGVDPYTGRMTETGIDFLRGLLDERNTKNQVTRTHRQRQTRRVAGRPHTPEK